MLSNEILTLVEQAQKLIDFLNPNNLDDENISYVLDNIWSKLEDIKELVELMD